MGHIPGHYVETSSEADLTRGIWLGPSSPRYSHGYGDLRHLPTVLVETHSLKPYRQRVLGTYVLLESSLRTLGNESRALQQAMVADASAAAAVVPLNGSRSTGKRTTLDFLGISSEAYVSPATQAKEIRWLGARTN